jgi:hypothetical protein
MYDDMFRTYESIFTSSILVTNHITADNQKATIPPTESQFTFFFHACHLLTLSPERDCLVYTVYITIVNVNSSNPQSWETSVMQSHRVWKYDNQKAQ